jgi:hypothetical protein
MINAMAAELITTVSAEPGAAQDLDEEESDESDSDEGAAQGSESSGNVARKNRTGTKKKRKLEMKEARREYRQVCAVQHLFTPLWY